MAKCTVDLDSYADGSDLEIQIRQIICKDDAVRAVIYAWLSDKRKEESQKNKAWGWKYTPFSEGDKITFVYHEMKLAAKITCVDNDYYDGACIVLYATLDKRSANRHLEKKADIQ